MICFELRIICTYHRFQKIGFELQIISNDFKLFCKVTYELIFGTVYVMVDLGILPWQGFHDIALWSTT